MEFISNVSSGFDPNKPSLFELISEHQLRDLLEPSLRYVLSLITQRHPRYLIHIYNRFDEVYALSMLLVERHYLKTWSGSFTENFYGLKRERMLSVPSGRLPRAEKVAGEIVREATKLSQRDIWKSLFMVIGVPYLKRKLDEAYEIHAGGAAANLFGASYRYNQSRLRDNASLKEKFTYWMKIILRKTYPFINATYYLTMLAFNLGYLFDKSYYHTPFHYIFKTRMRRLTEADHRVAMESSTHSRNPSIGVPPLSFASLLNPIILSRIVVPRFLDSLKILLPTSIFFLKFLEWWHASDFARQLSAKTSSSLELPPPRFGPSPPSPDSKLVQDGVVVELPADSKICPICKEEITNPTATQTGYVFCYPCVFRWVGGGDDEQQSGESLGEERKGKCPITGVKLLGGIEGLRRLMV